MKTELVKTDLKLLDVYTEDGYIRDREDYCFGRKYKYTFESNELYGHDLTVFRKKEVPETLYEWKKKNGISNDDLLDWLIKNYK